MEIGSVAYWDVVVVPPVVPPPPVVVVPEVDDVRTLLMVNAVVLGGTDHVSVQVTVALLE
jgi:hypothetical protein